MKDLNKIFVNNGIYQHRGCADSLFLCGFVNNTKIGKLTEYKQTSKDKLYEKTNNSFFLDAKNTLFSDRENYEMIGITGHRFYLTEDETFLVL